MSGMAFVSKVLHANLPIAQMLVDELWAASIPCRLIMQSEQPHIKIFSDTIADTAANVIYVGDKIVLLSYSYHQCLYNKNCFDIAEPNSIEKLIAKLKSIRFIAK